MLQCLCQVLCVWDAVSPLPEKWRRRSGSPQRWQSTHVKRPWGQRTKLNFCFKSLSNTRLSSSTIQTTPTLWFSSPAQYPSQLIQMKKRKARGLQITFVVVYFRLAANCPLLFAACCSGGEGEISGWSSFGAVTQICGPLLWVVTLNGTVTHTWRICNVLGNNLRPRNQTHNLYVAMQ